MVFSIGMFAVGFLTGLVCGILVVYSLLKDEPKPLPAQLTPPQSRSLTRIRSDLMGLHAQLSEDDDTLPSLNGL
jgi:hypothetical protein